MDFHPPQGAHTSYLRTLSKIVDLLGLGGLASQDISFKGAAHLTSNFVSVNTLKRSFFASRCPTFTGHRLRRFALSSSSSKGGASYIRLPFRQSPRSKYFASRCERSRRDAPASIGRFRPLNEGPRILQPIPDSSTLS